MNNTPQVSVCMITYNQEAFVEEAIDSVLEQDVEFPIEIVIGDDCSSDGTQKLIASMIQRRPRDFKAVFNEERVGMTRNFVTTISRCKGRYIALLEGDDYWLGRDKIRRQLETLENDESAVGAFHDCVVRFEESGEEHLRIGDQSIDRRVNLASLLCARTMATATMFFRNCLDWANLPPWFYLIPNPDYGLAALLALEGDWVYVEGPLSVYRRHAGGIWSGHSGSIVHQRTIQFFQALAKAEEFSSVRLPIQWRLTTEHRRLAKTLAQEGQSRRSWKAFIQGGIYRGDQAFRPRVTAGMYLREFVRTMMQSS